MRSREDFYQPGLPARPGEHYRAFVRFVARHAGQSILDLGCGFGAYSLALAGQGRLCIGCDINREYVETAASAGVPAVLADSVLPFRDQSFDTVMLLEVIEHVPALETILQEAFRVARRNVLITVPNAENIDLLKANDVTYAHMLSSDHVNFFDLPALDGLLRRFGKDVSIHRGDPIYPFWFEAKSGAYYALRVLYRARILKPRFFTRLYAVATVREN